MKKNPEKTAQTRKTIIEAFWVVAAKRGLDNTTISEVAKTAGLNRGTFYVYFSDIEDLLYHAERDIISDLRSKLDEVLTIEDFTDFHRVSSKVIEIFGKHDDKFFMLLGKDGDPMFRDMRLPYSLPY